MTFQEKFDYLNKKYAKKVDLTKLTQSFAAQIEMTDDDCHGIFYIAYIDGNFACEPYNYYDNTVAIAINSLLLEDIINGKEDAVDCFLNGRFFLTGNKEHAQMMMEALKPVKKAPAKKSAPKVEAEVKTEEKKAAPKVVAEVKTEVKPAEKKTASKKSTKKETK